MCSGVDPVDCCCTSTAAFAPSSKAAASLWRCSVAICSGWSSICSNPPHSSSSLAAATLLTHPPHSLQQPSSLILLTRCSNPPHSSSSLAAATLLTRCSNLSHSLQQSTLHTGVSTEIDTCSACTPSGAKQHTRLILARSLFLTARARSTEYASTMIG